MKQKLNKLNHFEDDTIVFNIDSNIFLLSNNYLQTIVLLFKKKNVAKRQANIAYCDNQKTRDIAINHIVILQYYNLNKDDLKQTDGACKRESFQF